MISPLVNSIVISAFGFLIGIILQIAMMVMPEKSRPEDSTGDADSGLQGWAERVREASQEGKEAWQNKSARTAMISFYAFIAILILVIRYSPLEMNWLVFLVSFFVGFILFQTIFERAKSRKSSSESGSSDNSQP